MQITNESEKNQVIEDIRAGMYGEEDSAQFNEIMDDLRAFKSSTVSSDDKGIAGAQEDPSFKDELVYGAGLATRSMAQGAAGLGGLVMDPMAYLMNLGLEKAGAPEKYRFAENQRGLVSDYLTELGLPKPETKSDRILSAATEGITGGGIVTKIASLPTVVAKSPYLSRILSSPYEIVGAGAAGAGSQYAEEKGAGVVGQTVAGVASAITMPLSAAAIKRIADTATYFGKTSTGRRVGRKLVEATDDPELVIKNLEDAEDIVPGSQQTAGVASARGGVDPETGLVYGDAGLLQAEAIIKASNPSLFALRLSQQNAARRAYLQSQIDELGDPETMRLTRDEVTAPMREEALKQGNVVNIQPVLDLIDGILQSARGTRDAVKQSLPDFRKRLEEIKSLNLADEADRLYELRKDIKDAMSGSPDPKKSGWKLAKAELQNVVNALDDSIEKVSPGYKAYLKEYHQLSQRVNQAEKLIIMRDKGSVASIDPFTGQEMLSQARFKNLVLGEKGQTGMSKVLTDDQLTVMTKIADDLDRSMTITSPQVKAAGSDTARNTVGNALGTVVGDVLANNRTMRLAGDLFSWVGRLTKAKQNELMIEAMLDPKLAAMLMRDATRIDALKASRALWDKFVSLSAGSLIGITSSADPALIAETKNTANEVAILSEEVPE